MNTLNKRHKSKLFNVFILLFIIKFILPAGGPLYKLLTMKDFIKHQLRSSLQLITNIYVSKTKSRLNVRKCIFKKRTVNTWNKLPNRIISCISINEFKNNFKKFNYFIDND